MNPLPVVPSRRSRIAVWLVLLLLAALAWAIVIQQSEMMGDVNQVVPEMSSMGQPTPGMADVSPVPKETQPTPTSILLYLAVWVSMMVAMMFPAVTPVVAQFDTIRQSRRATGQGAAPTWIFLVGYLVVWSLFGVAAYLLSLALPDLGMMAPGLRADYPVAAGLILIGAGLYQLSPLKQACLGTCRSPENILLHSWRDGNVGSLRMGIEQGAYCLGSSWALMLVLFVVGMMNLVGMVILSVVIFIEKVIPHGPLISKPAALALIVFGLTTLLMPLLQWTIG